MDTWDMKPHAPAEYRGEFQPIATTAPGVTLSEHLPLLASQAHHLAVVNSIGATVNTNDHHAGYYYNLTGHVPDSTFLSLGNNRTPMPDDWPYMGCVAASRRPPHAELPNAITLPHKPSKLPYTRPGQFAARLGVEHDPLYLSGSHDTPLQFHAPALVLEGNVTTRRLTDRQSLLATIDQGRRDFDAFADVRTWSRQQDRAVSLLTSTKTTSAFDVSSESPELRARYGETVNGMSLLLARRLVEAGVPFITVFWMENEKIASQCKSAGGWDTHGNNFNSLKDNRLPPVDRALSALIEDLSNRRTLDETVVYCVGEFARTPKINGKAGRDHWARSMAVLLAGGGFKKGSVYGSTNDEGMEPADKPCTPDDISATIAHALGINPHQELTTSSSRPIKLFREGTIIDELLA